MREVRDDVRLAKQLAPRALERVGRGVGGVPLGDDVVVGHVLQREPGRDEVGRLRIARAALGVHGVEQAVPRELRMKGEPDESALQPVVDRMRKRSRDVRIDLTAGCCASIRYRKPRESLAKRRPSGRSRT